MREAKCSRDRSADGQRSATCAAEFLESIRPRVEPGPEEHELREAVGEHCIDRGGDRGGTKRDVIDAAERRDPREGLGEGPRQGWRC